MITKELATYFIEEAFGSYSGHMSMIPNNPSLQGLARAHGCADSNGRIERESMKQFLRDIADAIEVDDRL